MEPPVPPIAHPDQVDHPVLREMASQAAWVAKLEEAVEVLEDLVLDLLPDEEDEPRPGSEADPDDEDPLAVALSVVRAAYEDEDRGLEERITGWLAQDPEHWPIFRLAVLDPWQEAPGRWRAEAPRWVRVLGTDAALAHYQQDPFGRRRTLDL